MNYLKLQNNYRQVEDASNRVANYFLSRGYRVGDSVALLMENRPEFVCLWFGLSKVGVLPALVNTNLRGESLAHSIRAAACKGIIYGAELEQGE